MFTDVQWWILQGKSFQEMVPWPSWLRRGANNAKISSSILLGTSLIGACGVVGSASALQAEGHRFDSGLVQYFFESYFYGAYFTLW